MSTLTNIILLLSVIATKTPIYHSDIDENDEIFVYVKHYCHYSKKACKHLKRIKNITIVDVINKEFVRYDQNTDTFIPVKTPVPGKLMGAFDVRNTVPQIFIYKNSQWHYIGGSDDVIQLNIVKNNNKKNPSPSLKL